jgi:hypothetical protein
MLGFVIIFIGVFQLNEKPAEHSSRLSDDFMELESFSNSETISEHRYSTSSRRSSQNKKNDAIDIAYFHAHSSDDEED